MSGDYGRGYLEILNDTDIVLNPPPNSRAKKTSKFRFTKVLDQAVSQANVFEETCLPLVAGVLSQDKSNGLLFAYGVSNSGKTHSILGSNQHEQAGVLPRALAVIFKSISLLQDSGEASQYRPVGLQDIERIDPAGLEALQEGLSNEMEAIKSLDSDLSTISRKLNIPLDDICVEDLLGQGNSTIDSHIVSLPEGMDYAVWISCAEVYTEKIYDLLAEPPESSIPALGVIDPKRPTLSLKTDVSTGQKYVHGLKEIRVRTLEEALLVVRAGLRQRQVFTTLLNKVSSRSHCIFTIKILKARQFGISAAATAANGKTSVSRLSIVDLAGSERIRNTNSTGQRRKEAGDINNSLMVLGHCMEILRLNQMRGSKSPQIVPYNRSKLTQLFQSVLDGQSRDSRVCLIVNINPFQNEFDETIQTLRFSSAAMDVSTVRQPGANDDKVAVQRAPSTIKQKIMISSSTISYTAAELDRTDDHRKQTPESDMLLLALRNQVDDLYEKLQASESRYCSLDTELREEVMMNLADRILAACTMKDTQSRSTSPITCLTKKDTQSRSTSPLAFESMDVEQSETNVQDEASSSHISSEQICQAMTTAETQGQSGDDEVRRLEIALAKSEEKRIVLERALEKANGSIRAWQSWFANAPNMNPNVAHNNIDLTATSSTNNLIDSSFPHGAVGLNSVNVDSLPTQLDGLNLSTADIESSKASFEDMGRIQEVEQYVVEQALRQEDFIDQIVEGEDLVDEASVNEDINEDSNQDDAYVDRTTCDESVIEDLDSTNIVGQEEFVDGTILETDFIEYTDYAISHDGAETVEVKPEGDDDAAIDASVSAADTPAIVKEEQKPLRKPDRDSAEPQPDQDSSRSTAVLVGEATGSARTALFLSAPTTISSGKNRRSLPTVVIEIPAVRRSQRRSMVETRPVRKMNPEADQISTLSTFSSTNSAPPVKRARISRTMATSTLLIDRDDACGQGQIQQPVTQSDNRLEYEGSSYSKDSLDDDERGDTYRTPQRTRRASSERHYYIEDHLGTSLAEVSPIRSLYPSLQKLWPENQLKQDNKQQQRARMEAARRDLSNPFLDEDSDLPSEDEFFLKKSILAEGLGSQSKESDITSGDEFDSQNTNHDLSSEDELFPKQTMLMGRLDNRSRGDDTIPTSGGPTEFEHGSYSEYGSEYGSVLGSPESRSRTFADTLNVQIGGDQDAIAGEFEKVSHEEMGGVLTTPCKKRKRKLRAKKAVFEDEMEETVGMPPPPPTRGRKKSYGRK
ncbi:hypothetical protein BGZ58_007249 [Dissophora ornata]|nr:hypothetical protein BGZ58_007249 [Dissophora ornata]